MSPSNPYISCQLRQLIYYHLDNNLVRNALFLAGRLHAHEPRSSEASYLLSLCHLLSGQVKAAWDYSKSAGSRGTHVGCSYVYAQACLDLGKYVDGVTALERSKGLWVSRNNWNKHSETRRQHLPDAAAVYCLQGKLWHGYDDLNKAVECYVESLKLNPFMWDAFLGLCDTGVNIRVPNIYKMSSEMLSMMSTSQSDPELNAASGTQQTTAQYNESASLDPFTSATNRNEPSSSYNSSVLWEKFNGGNINNASVSASHEGFETPGGQRNESDDFRLANGSNAAEGTWEPPLAPVRKTRTVPTMNIDTTSDPPPRMRQASIKSRTRARTDNEDQSASQTERESAVAARIGERKRTISGQAAHPLPPQPTEPGAPQRRSVRLFNQIKPTSSKLSSTALGPREGRELRKVRATGTKGRTATTSSVGRVVSGNRKYLNESQDVDMRDAKPVSSSYQSMHPPPTRNASMDKSKEIEALGWLLDLLSKLSVGFFALSRYKCSDAIHYFESLPPGQRETPWVLSQVGRAYYEQAMYLEAEKYFFRVKTLAPSQLEDMEIYSTVLWHLRNEVEIAYLAHELMEIDRLSPQSWCAIGNTFSIQRDHNQALKCFKRATQLDPKFAYAFTLQGHEYVANEEYDRALDAYRSGISADNRHYNAWYGLGTVYDRMGKLDFAEQHFRNAANINPTNAVLICCIGLLLEKMDDPQSALVQYGRASSLAPHSVLARFRKARALMKLQELRLALAELKILKDMAPDEANVHYLLGKLYKMLRDKGNAIKHFTTALNLDPKAAQYIKDAMESIDDDEEDNEDMA